MFFPLNQSCLIFALNRNINDDIHIRSYFLHSFKTIIITHLMIPSWKKSLNSIQKLLFFLSLSPFLHFETIYLSQVILVKIYKPNWQTWKKLHINFKIWMGTTEKMSDGLIWKPCIDSNSSHPLRWFSYRWNIFGKKNFWSDFDQKWKSVVKEARYWPKLKPYKCQKPLILRKFFFPSRVFINSWRVENK